jgi:hypothetical protein
LVKAKNVTPEATEIKEADGVIFMKANRPLTVQEHEEVSQKLRYEEDNTGLKIVLVPFSLELTDGEG